MKWLQLFQRLDLFLFQWCMARQRRAELAAIGRAISKTADCWFYVLFACSIALLGKQSDGAFLPTFCFAFAMERIFYFGLKYSCRRNRPADALDNFLSFITPADKFSFPSGHTSAAFLFTVLATSQFLPHLLIWSVLVALSRIFLRVHFPIDTVIGAALGIGVGTISLQEDGMF